MDFACIDIGGTNTLVGVGNEDFHVIEKVKTRSFLTDIRGSLDGILGTEGYELGDVNRIGVAAAGPVDREKGVFYPPNIDMERVALTEPFRHLPVDVHILNDCSAAALGEYVYGDHDADSLVYLTISTGIGAGIVMDGELVEGRNGNFGEIGHMIMDNNGRRCGCGGRDHWEAYCSGANLPAMAEELFGYAFSDARKIFDAYRKGDERAEQVVRQMQEYNVKGVANIVNIFDPELITLGGGVALNHDDIVVEGLRERINAEVVNSVPTIQTCTLEEEAVIHGLRAICNGVEI